MPESCDALPEDTPPSKPVRRRPGRSRTLDDTDAGKRTSLDIISSFDMGMVDLSFNTTASTSITSARGDSKMGGSGIAAAMRVATLEATMEEEEENKMKERENGGGDNDEEIELSNYDILVDCIEDDNDALKNKSEPSRRKEEDNDDNDEQLKDTEKTPDNDKEKEKGEKGEGETAEGNDEAKKKDETMEQQKNDKDDKREDVDCDRYHLTSSTNHVGNNRLEVFLNMNRKEFEDHVASSNEEGCSNVVNKIYDIVCNQCIPRGRFLASKLNTLRGGFQYQILPENICRAIIRNALERPPMVAVPVPSNVQSQNNNSQADPNNALMEDDFEMKRRRRSSLLRRSVSESQLNLGFLRDDKKKTLRILPDDFDTSDDDSDDDNGDLDQVPEMVQSVNQQLPRRAKPKVPVKSSDLNNLDIIFNMSRNKLIINDKFYGNNRLKVLLSLQEMSYNSESATPKSQDKIVKDIIRTVTNFWGGRFLAESTLQYTKLDEYDAARALGKVLSATPRLSLNSGGTKRPSQVKAAALEAISDGIGLSEGDDMSNLRSEAVKSLQKRKQRQGLTNKIRGLTTATAASVPVVPSSASSVSSGATDVSLNYALQNMEIKRHPRHNDRKMSNASTTSSIDSRQNC